MTGLDWGGILKRVLDAQVEWLIFWLAALAVGVVVGCWAAAKVRRQSAQQEPPASQLLSKFRELHSRGELSDAEYRTIKTTLAARLQDELKGDDQTA
jgi:uncharacterized membrane protein